MFHMSLPTLYVPLVEDFFKLLFLFPRTMLLIVVNNQRTNSTEEGPCWGAHGRLASHKITRLLLSPKVHYRVHKSPPLDTILRQFHNLQF
jgi:hypothetical protein